MGRGVPAGISGARRASGYFIAGGNGAMARYMPS
jgi:hypothetical protein